MCRVHALTLFLLFILSVLSPAEDANGSVRKIAITFDDVPMSGPDPGIRHVEEINRTILRQLRIYGAPAVGFVNEKLIHHPYELDRRERILESWLDAGFELGNHTYSHIDLHLSGVEQFIADLQKGETFSAALAQRKGKAIRYFRFPYLHEGLTPEVREVVQARIKALGYKIAPASITNDDFIFSSAYRQAAINGSESDRSWIGEAYVRYLQQIVAFHEERARFLFGRDIAHIIIFHINELNADMMSNILQMLRTRGYTFVTLGAALSDPAYNHLDNYFGRQGISALQRWYHSEGKMKYWGNQPTAPPRVNELYEKASAAGY